MVLVFLGHPVSGIIHDVAFGAFVGFWANLCCILMESYAVWPSVCGFLHSVYAVKGRPCWSRGPHVIPLLGRIVFLSGHIAADGKLSRLHPLTGEYASTDVYTQVSVLRMSFSSFIAPGMDLLGCAVSLHGTFWNCHGVFRSPSCIRL